MSNGPDWPAIVAAVVAAGAAVVSVVLWVPKAIAASRHKAASDLQPKFEGFDEDIDELRRELVELRREDADLRLRVAVLETKVTIEEKLDRLFERLDARPGGD